MWDIHRFETLKTTQDTALDAMRDGAPAGTVIVADAMESGRGRFGNIWQAPKGNLYLSLVLRPPVHHAIGDYALITAVAVAQAVQPFLQKDVSAQLKWPNDVLIQDKKLSGILIEAQWDVAKCTGLVIGVGINVLNPPEGRTSVAEHCASPVTVDAVCEAFLAALQDNLQVYEGQGLSAIRTAWLARAWRLGEEIQFRRVAGEDPIIGVFEGLSEAGALHLRAVDGTLIEMQSGEIIQTG